MFILSVLFQTLIYAHPIQHIKGALQFDKYCSNLAHQGFQDIVVNQKISPPNKTELKFFQWVYPNDGYQVEFYLDSTSTQPYATIIGPKNTRYLSQLCGFQYPISNRVLKVTVDEYVVGDSEFLFLTPESYAIVKETN
ncbi:hypothetical protein BC833DRAFT_607458, partial [Globomyces pollinis-pini]